MLTVEDLVLELGIASDKLNPRGYPCDGCGRLLPLFALIPQNDDMASCACCLIDAERATTPLFELGWNDIRGMRASELAKSDWTQMPDVPQSVRETWQPYRQALRDITQQAVIPAEVIWPQQPSTEGAVS